MKDKIIAEIRQFRDAHAARFGNDVDAILNDWLKQDTGAKRGRKPTKPHTGKAAAK